MAVDLAVGEQAMAGESKGKVPRWLRGRLLDSELHSVSEAVRKAELSTTGEIIPMIVSRSTSLGHLPLVWGLILFSLFQVWQVRAPDLLVGDMYWWLTPGVFALCLVLGYSISSLHFLQRWMISSEDQAHEVHERAELEFLRGRLQHPERKTGVLIFVSLLERRVVILADHGISQKISHTLWRDMVTALKSEIKEGRLGAGMNAAIASCGKVLTEHFPSVGQANPNEVCNELVLKE